MLQLKNIIKRYEAGEGAVTALDGVDLTFRSCEFVSVLGPSGCGKTTLLNLIGGLDRYTEGDLVINGRSTKDFRARDWDTYRNHTVGFVFQSYNLIPHQTVLANVELALTLSGVSKAERRRRATEALEKVGLGDQLHKRPNQMSGGQMQRVAIARALVNDPDILLADEPTGALDSVTSVQIMELLKEIAATRLVVMVTHNPELAETYSTRLVRLLDGRVIGDSAPYEAPTEEAPPAAAVKTKKTSMSFWTALSLSLRNLMTKKTRTALMSFAGSIGIIGIALILALSTGINNYINDVQRDTLSSYPIQLQAESTDMSALMITMMGLQAENEEHDLDKVYSSSVMDDLLNAVTQTETTKNNLAKFKEHLEDKNNPMGEYISAIQYGYDLQMPVFTKDPDGKIVKSDVQEMMQSMMANIYGMDTENVGNMMAMSGMDGFGGIKVWQEMLPGKKGELVSPLVKEQYEPIKGDWPTAYDEIVLVVNERNEISDLMLFSLGLVSEEAMQEVMAASLRGEEIESEQMSWSYEELMAKTFRLVLGSSYYQKDLKGDGWHDVSTTETGMQYLYDNGIDLKIVGIVRPSEDATAAMLTGTIGYTSALTEHVIAKGLESEAVKAQLADKETDVLSGLPFPKENDQGPTADEQRATVEEYVRTLSAAEKADLYTYVMSKPTEEYLRTAVDSVLDGKSRAEIEAVLLSAALTETGMSEDELRQYFSEMEDEALYEMVEKAIREQVAAQYAEGVQASLGALTTDALSMMCDGLVPTLTDEQIADLYDQYLPPMVSDSTYEENLQLLGWVDRASPDRISIYANTFEDKDLIGERIEAYNDTVAEEDRITYTDYVKLLMSSITTIINAISYVLVAFVSISLVVSSIMIGIITYISVLERTKEIGILRAIGASKKDISRVFNAETLIVGLGAGLIGIGLSILLCIPINFIVQALTGLTNIRAVVPPVAAIVLVAISMLLTLIAGLIPSRLAAKKDPVVALRSE